MQIGLIGLGRMGMNMARRLIRGGHGVVAYNRTPDRVDEIVKEGARGAYSLEELVKTLTPPRILWLMLPAGRPVDEHIGRLQPILKGGDIMIDGGNSYYKDDIRHEEELKSAGIRYMDVGIRSQGLTGGIDEGKNDIVWRHGDGLFGIGLLYRARTIPDVRHYRAGFSLKT